MNLRQLPRSVRAVIAASVAVGLGTILYRTGDLSTWRTPDVLAFLGLSIATVVGEQFTVQIRQHTETKNVSVTDALFAGALMLARPSVLTMAVAVGVLAGHTMRGTKGYKVAFNVGSFLAAITAAELVYGAIASGPGTGPINWAAASAGMVAFFVVNAGSVVSVIALVERRSFADVFFPIYGIEAGHTVGNGLIGVTGAAVYAAAPAALPLGLIALAVAFAGYSVWAERTAGSARLQPVGR